MTNGSLSHHLAVVIFPHDHYESHLDSTRRTTDEGLEKENFQKAAETLADIWSHTEIDNKNVVTQALLPGCKASLDEVDPVFNSRDTICREMRGPQLLLTIPNQLVECFSQQIRSIPISV